MHHYHITLIPDITPTPTPAAPQGKCHGHWLSPRHGSPTCPGGRLLTMGTCSCPGLRHGVTKLHDSNEKFTQERSCPWRHPTPWEPGPKMKELSESNQLINQHYQQGWGWGDEGGEVVGGGGRFHVSMKGKPFSLKKKKEQTRVMHGQIRGHDLRTRPASPRLKRLSQGHGRLAS